MFFFIKQSFPIQLLLESKDCFSSVGGKLNGFLNLMVVLVNWSFIIDFLLSNGRFRPMSVKSNSCLSYVVVKSQMSIK